MDGVDKTGLAGLVWGGYAGTGVLRFYFFGGIIWWLYPAAYAGRFLLVVGIGRGVVFIFKQEKRARPFWIIIP